MMNTPTVEATAAVAAAVAGPLFSAALQTLQDKYDSYGKTELAEIGAIKKAYEACCYSLEKESSLTTLKAYSQGVNNRSLPVYFEMEATKSVPVLFIKGFYPNADLLDWMRFLGKTALRHHTEEMLGYICQYQHERDQRVWGKRGYNYDPTNLFFEEFKCWLVELSKAPLDETTYNIVEGRVAYLSELLNRNVFSPGTDRPTRLQTIAYLKDILEKGVKPLINYTKNRRAARDHFETLRLHIELSIREGLKFLFYVFRDTTNTPKNFILEQIRTPKSPSYLESIDKNQSGRLLNTLVKSPAFMIVFPQLLSALEPAEEYTMIELSKNDFYSEKNEVLYPFASATETILTWYQTQSPSGINKCFQQRELIKEFLKLHGLLHRLCLFYIICDFLYELAGDGGNLLVYSVAACKVKEALTAYKMLSDELKTTIDKLYESADKYKRFLIDNPKEISAKTGSESWNINYAFTNKAHENFNKNLVIIKKTIVEIEGKIVEVNTKDYEQLVKRRLIFVSELIDNFSSPAAIAEIRSAQASQSTIHRQLGVSPAKVQERLIAPSVDVAHEDYQYAQQLYKEAFEKGSVGNFTILEQALKAYIVLIKNTPKDCTLRVECANILIALGKNDKALELLSGILEKLDPQHEGALMSRAQLYKARGEYGKSRDDLEKVLAKDPNHPQAKTELSNLIGLKHSAYEKLQNQLRPAFS